MSANYKKIISNVEEFIFELFKEKLDDSHHYHSFKHTKETVKMCSEMGEHYGLKEEEIAMLIIAAYFHDTGYTEKYNGHEEVSVKIAKDYLSKTDLGSEFIDEVLKLILSTKAGIEPIGLFQEILHDADYINVGKKKFFRRAELLRLEWQDVLEKSYDDDEWNKKQLKFLTNLKFKTKYALSNFSKQRAKNILEQRESLSKAERKSKKLGRGIDTMYRNLYRSNIDLSSIADSKANMLISINTIIMSVIVAAVGSGFTFSGNDFIKHIRFTIPMALLILGCLISVIFAILSALPSITNKEVSKKKIKERKRSVLFFGTYTELELDEFLENTEYLRHEQDVLYDNMSIDLYNLGHVLKRKYRLLKWAYWTFLGALCLTMVSFLLIFALSA